MRGDETQPTREVASEGDGTLVRRGPRHAAPKKSLLTKLQAPAGKAIAIAAMPTAVIVGLGLTPKLALADDKDIPFAPGPCVTRSDEPEETAKPSETPKPSGTETAKPDPSGSAGNGGGDEGDEPKPGASPSASEKDTAKDTAKDEAATPAAKPSAKAPAASPSATKTRDPWDPLGVGDALHDIFDGLGKKKTPSPTAEPSKPTDGATSKPSTKPSGDAKPTTKPSDKSSDKSSDKAKPSTRQGREADAIRDAAERAGAGVEELSDDAKGLDPKKDEDIPDGAKPRFPCPTADPEALAAADLEPGLPLLPDDPWILNSSLLTLTGLDYKGIVEVQTGSGKIKKVLKFTASSVDIKDLHQEVVYPEGKTAHVEARKGSTSTIRNGTVTMYTEELKGNLFGLIPITFSPDSPPPLNVPFAFFTNVKVTQAGQFGGTLKVPGLHNYMTG
ncbi:hypothetical protein ABT160_17315 [Streptomyces sp. NPDC001941]|uniref:hypothetical protein n=1 Tax=Streptomyces sp. NPDC001941 TaxID=3154659 RepID=UPI00332228AE